MPTTPSPHAIDQHLLRRVAVEAGRDPRTVATVLAGGGTATSRAAVSAALERLGLSRLLGADGERAPGPEAA